MKNSLSRTAGELRAGKGWGAHAVSGKRWGARAVHGGVHASRVGERECVFKSAERRAGIAHIAQAVFAANARYLRDALSARHKTPSAQALVLRHRGYGRTAPERVSRRRGRPHAGSAEQAHKRLDGRHEEMKSQPWL